MDYDSVLKGLFIELDGELHFWNDVCGNDNFFAAEVETSFAILCAESLVQLNSCLNKENFEPPHKIIHKLSGAIGLLGFYRVNCFFSALESKLIKKPKLYDKHIYEEIDVILNRVLFVIGKYKK